MEQTSAQETQGILLKGPSRVFSNVFLIIVLALISGFVIGFIMRSIKPFNNFLTTTPRITTPSAIPSQTTITEQELPIGLTILKHPLVYQWRGSVEGLLTEKTTDMITLTKDGNKITIPIDPKGTAFFDPRTGKADEGIKPTTVDNIPIGSYLRGEFYATPIPGDKNKIAGASFMVDVEKSQ